MQFARLIARDGGTGALPSEQKGDATAGVPPKTVPPFLPRTLCVQLPI
jgi:hypothetical protein